MVTTASVPSTSRNESPCDESIFALHLLQKLQRAKMILLQYMHLYAASLRAASNKAQAKQHKASIVGFLSAILGPAGSMIESF